jgi:curved DNA-binding protein CbpA
MTDRELIDKLIKSNKPSDIFPDDWKKLYRDYCKLIHPDYHPNSLAAEAMAKMNNYKDILENGTKFTDESGDFRVFEKKNRIYCN